jgi:hypothetical protein
MPNALPPLTPPDTKKTPQNPKKHPQKQPKPTHHSKQNPLKTSGLNKKRMERAMRFEVLGWELRVNGLGWEGGE